MSLIVYILLLVSLVAFSHGSDMNVFPDSYGGKLVSASERVSVGDVRLLIEDDTSNTGDKYLASVTNIEILRFLRFYNGHVKKAYDGLTKHGEWRASYLTFDKELETEFENSVLNDELFWLGPTKEDQSCVTLVIRTQLHMDEDYHNDPAYFAKFFVWVLEKGREMYGVGTEKDACLIMDRTDATRRDGVVMTDNFDLSVIPNLIHLFQTMYTTMYYNYPELLMKAEVFPSSWFFSTCFKLTSGILDASLRKRFSFVRESEISDLMLQKFDKYLVPDMFGGSFAKSGWYPSSTEAYKYVNSQNAEAWSTSEQQVNSENRSFTDNSNDNYCTHISYEMRQTGMDIGKKTVYATAREPRSRSVAI